ncbi:MAG: hypothetical protein Q8O56_05255 [Solirubrobacteraceae bacterium]|nr:hypothetical protein [Solirubrobacteraceae bacterium]
MTTADARFDRRTGAMRFTMPLADHLLAPRLGGVAPALDDAQRAALERAGLLAGGELIERLQAARHAAMLARQTVRISRLGGEARGWLGEHALALTVGRGEGWVELLVSTPPFFADTVARLVELGPRPTPAPGATPDAADSRWQVAVDPARGAPAGPGPRSLDVLDTEAGLWQVQPGDAGIDEMSPISSERLWRALTSMAAR